MLCCSVQVLPIRVRQCLKKLRREVAQLRSFMPAE